MSIFHELGFPKPNRRTLFWLVCIVIRLLIATAFTTLSLEWDQSFPYVVGGIGIVGGLGFWRNRIVDNKKNIWWYRSVHGLLWIGGGLSAILVRYFVGRDAAAGAIAAFFYGDVLFGILTAAFGTPSWIKKKRSDEFELESLAQGSNETQTGSLGSPILVTDENGNLSVDDKRFITLSKSKLFGLDSSDPVWITPWSLAHLIQASLLGLAAYYISKDTSLNPLWIPCLLFSFLIVGWEAFENTNLEFKDWLPFSKGKIDSDANLAGDLIIGFSALWGVAYILDGVY